MPPSWRTLYELTKLDDTTFEANPSINWSIWTSSIPGLAVEANASINWGIVPSFSPRLADSFMIDAKLPRYRPIRFLRMRLNSLHSTIAGRHIRHAAVAGG